MSLVVVSNRITRGNANEPITGGLAAALLPIVEKSGAIWVGSSGRVRDGVQKEPFAEVEALGTGALAMLDLPAAHYGGYYEGFANSALWPALHSRADLIRVSQGDYLSYREVNAFMARALLRFRKTDTAFWIQDYHFLALGAELRDLGVTQPIGFFLHTPWPARDVIEGVPHHRDLVQAMLAYDLIGFQTDDDCENFASYLTSTLGLVVDDGVVMSRHGATRIAVFPIGIDVEKFARQAAKSVSHPDVSRLRRSLNGEKLAIGVDRLDYSKGLVNRINAFDRMWTTHPSMARTVSLLQIATPSRGAIEAYGNLQSELAKLVSDVNGRHGEVDWTPIRYLNKGFSQTVLAGLYRTAQVGVVTPLHDGMKFGGEGICRCPKPRRSRCSCAVKVCRGGQRTGYGASGQSARYRRHGANDRGSAVDAVPRAAHALGGDDGEASAPFHPAMVHKLRRRAGARAGRKRGNGAAGYEPAGAVGASLRQRIAAET